MSQREGTFHWVTVLTVLVASLAMLGNDLVLAKGGGGRGGGAGMSRGGPAASGSVRPQHRATPARQPDTRRDVRDNRREVKQDVRDNRRDVKQDVRDERRDVRDDIRDEHRDHHVRRAGAVLTISAFSALSCTSSTIIVGGITYYRCGNTWYNRAHQSGDVVYIVVTAPAGY